MNDIAVREDVFTVSISFEDAVELDEEIVSSTTTLKVKLLEMFSCAGFLALGYKSWEEYLKSVAERAGLSTSMLRRYAANALTSGKLGFGADELPEGWTRNLTEILSDRKGFSDDDRRDVFDDAVSSVNGDMKKLTGAIISTVAKKHYVTSRGEEDDIVANIADRVMTGTVSVDEAYILCSMVERIKNDEVAAFVSNLSSSEAASVILTALPTTRAVDIVRTGLATGYLDAAGEMVPLGAVTERDMLNALNAEGVVRRLEIVQNKQRILERVCKSAYEFAKVDKHISNYHIAVILVSNYLLGTGGAWWREKDEGDDKWDLMLEAGIKSVKGERAIEDAIKAVMEQETDPACTYNALLCRCYITLEKILEEA